jgi:hypothetical protein
MATAKNTNGNARKPSAGDNIEKTIAAHLDQMRAFGRDKKAGDTAKQRAIELFQQDCLDGIANADSVGRYADAYAEGAQSNPASKAAFKSSLAAFGSPTVIKAWPELSATLNKLHAAKDKDVSRTVTGKDKFAQLYKLANRIKAEGAPVKVTDEYVKASVAKAKPSSDELAKLAKESLVDSVKALIGDKPSKALIDARNQFFKLLKVELPA